MDPQFPPFLRPSVEVEPWARDRATEGTHQLSTELLQKLAVSIKKESTRGHRRQVLKDLGQSQFYTWGPISFSFRLSAESPAFSLFLEQSKTAVGKVCSICTEAEDARSTVLQSEVEGSSWLRKIVPKHSAFPPAYVVQIFFLK